MNSYQIHDTRPTFPPSPYRPIVASLTTALIISSAANLVLAITLIIKNV